MVTYLFSNPRNVAYMISKTSSQVAIIISYQYIMSERNKRLPDMEKLAADEVISFHIEVRLYATHNSHSFYVKDTDVGDCFSMPLIFRHCHFAIQQSYGVFEKI